MKILIIADTRGNIANIMSVIDKEKPDAIIHLGGGVNDLEKIQFGGAIYLTRGKSDRAKFPNAGLLVVADKKILYTYGKKQNVNQGLNDLTGFAKMQGADYVFYADSSIPNFRERDNMQFICPGSLGGNVERFTYSVLIENKKHIKIKHFTLY